MCVYIVEWSNGRWEEGVDLFWGGGGVKWEGTLNRSNKQIGAYCTLGAVGLGSKPMVGSVGKGGGGGGVLSLCMAVVVWP